MEADVDRGERGRHLMGIGVRHSFPWNGVYALNSNWVESSFFGIRQR